MDSFEDYIKTSYRKIRNLFLRVQFFIDRRFTNREYLKFHCNICGHYPASPVERVKSREKPSCYYCGSTLRFRSIIAALSKELYGQILPLTDFPTDMSVTAVGMSDTPVYAGKLKNKFSYKNTFIHRSPYFDITNIENHAFNPVNFIITSDVFEHVHPPVDIAFDNLYKLLKKGGFVVFSVPYSNTGETVEHFPDLHDYSIIKKNGKKVLVNSASDGSTQYHNNLVFHGGCGKTLELRLFSKPSLINHFTVSGFEKIIFHDSSVPEFGILHDPPISPVITAHKPEKLDTFP